MFYALFYTGRTHFGPNKKRNYFYRFSSVFRNKLEFTYLFFLFDNFWSKTIPLYSTSNISHWYMVCYVPRGTKLYTIKNIYKPIKINHTKLTWTLIKIVTQIRLDLDFLFFNSQLINHFLKNTSVLIIVLRILQPFLKFLI